MEFTRRQLSDFFALIPGVTALHLMRSGTLHTILHSRSAPAFFGLTEKEFCDYYEQDAMNAVLLQDRYELRNKLRIIRETGENLSCTFRTYHKVRAFVWTHADLRVIGTCEGEPVLLSVLFDVSGNFLNNTPGGMFVYSAESNENDQFFFVSDNMLRLLGYSEQEFAEKTHNRFSEMIYQEDRSRVLEEINAQIASGDYDTCEYRVERRDGSLIWLHDEGHIITDEEGNKRFYVVVSDITQSVQERQRLVSQNRDLETMLNNISAGIAVYRRRNGKIAFEAANRQLCDELMVTQDQISSGDEKLLAAHVHPDDLDTTLRAMRRLTAPGAHVSYMLRYIRSGDSYKWLRCECTTVAQPDDSFLIFAVISDITAEKEAEANLERSRRKELREYQESFRSLLYENPQSLCTFHLNLTENRCVGEQGVSRFTINLLRADTVDGMIHNIMSVVIDPEERNTIQRLLSREALLKSFAAGRRREMVRYRRQGESGYVIWVQVVVNMVKNPITGDTEAVIFSEDIDDRVKNEEIIQHITNTEFDYISLVYAPDKIYYTRYLSDAIRSRFPGIVDTLGRSRSCDEIINMAAETWVHPDERARFCAELDIESLQGHLALAHDYTLTVKGIANKTDTTWKQLRFSWLDDSLTWLLVEQMDITDVIEKQQKELLDRFETERTLRQEADRANEAKSEFLSNVSHDMRTPLNAILGYGRLALQTADSDVREDYLRKIGIAGETLLSLINDTLDLQKIENSSVELKPHPVSCQEAIKGVVTVIRPLMEQKIFVLLLTARAPNLSTSIST